MPFSPCSDCTAPTAPDQRYCLGCGARLGAPRVDWRRPAATPAPTGDGAARWSRPLSAATLLVLATGVGLGAAAGPWTQGSGAAPGTPAGLVVVAQAAPTATSAPAAVEDPAEAEAEPEPVEVADPGPVEEETEVVAGDDPEPEPAADPDPEADADEDPVDDEPAAPAVPALAAPVGHVWVLQLTGRSYEELFAPDGRTPYLARELRAQGTLLHNFIAPAPSRSANGAALLGGLRGDPATPAECPPGGEPGPAGCTFPADVPTVLDRLTGAGKTWRGYLRGLGDQGCRRPGDPTDAGNPFVRFRSIADDPVCGSSVVDQRFLAQDLADEQATPALSLLLPDAAAAADPDAWLREVVPPILASKAFSTDGLLVITSDAGAPGDVRGGGGRVGALVLSPFAGQGTTVATPYDHFALLRTIGDAFGLDRLGYAAETHLPRFGRAIFTRSPR